TRAFRLDRRPACYTFSILGNDAPLYTRPQPEADPESIAGKLNVPAPIRRRTLAAHLEDYYGPGKSFCLYRRTLPPARGRKARDGQAAVLTPIPAGAIAVADLADWHYQPKPGHVAIDPERGRIAFPPRELPEDLLV